MVNKGYTYPMDISIALLSGLAGAVITALIGPYVGRASERRAHRAELLRSLIECDIKNASESTSIEEHRESIIKLKTNALIAGYYTNEVSDYIEYSMIEHSCRIEQRDLTSEEDEMLGQIMEHVSMAEIVYIDKITDPLWKIKFWRNRYNERKYKELTKETYKLLSVPYINGHWNKTIIESINR